VARQGQATEVLAQSIEGQAGVDEGPRIMSPEAPLGQSK